MSKVKYAVVNTEENTVDTPFFDSKKKAKQWFLDTTGVEWEEHYEVQAFNAEQRKAVREAPEQ